MQQKILFLPSTNSEGEPYLEQQEDCLNPSADSAPIRTASTKYPNAAES